MDNGDRMAWAWVAAPLAAILMVSVVVCAFGLALYQPATLLAALKIVAAVLVVSLVFGIPVAYAAEAIVGIPAVHLLESRHWLSWPPLIAIASVTGALAFTGAEALFLGEWDWVSGSLVGGLAGATAGACLWLVGLRIRTQAPRP
jgi:ABC-type polysaccharide/polyol phosphate export permease